MTVLPVVGCTRWFRRVVGRRRPSRWLRVPSRVTFQVEPAGPPGASREPGDSLSTGGPAGD